MSSLVHSLPDPSDVDPLVPEIFPQTAMLARSLMALVQGVGAAVRELPDLDDHQYMMDKVTAHDLLAGMAYLAACAAGLPGDRPSQRAARVHVAMEKVVAAALAWFPDPAIKRPVEVTTTGGPPA